MTRVNRAVKGQKAKVKGRLCVVNACLGLAVLVRCMVDFRLRSLCAELTTLGKLFTPSGSLCAELTFDSVVEDRRGGRRRGSQVSAPTNHLHV